MERPAMLLYVESDFGRIVDNDAAHRATAPARVLRDEVGAVLAAFEKATGLQVCFKRLSDRWQDIDGVDVVGLFAEHRSSFCQSVKAHSFAKCAKCDHADLPAVCSPPDGRVVEPFVRTCHAGADEVLLPLWSDGVLVAVLFVGQFARQRRTLSQPTRDVRDEGARQLGLAGVAALPHLDDPDVQHVRTLLLALRTYVHDVLRRLDGRRHERPSGRRGVIEAYIGESISSGPTLAELARRLSLSHTRARHVVRELTGCSFQDLVKERRIMVAKDLLTNSDGTVAWIARQTGFNDVAYFCRYFKRHTGSTPTMFRERYRNVISV